MPKAIVAPDVPRVPWSRHAAMMSERWHKAEDCSIIARKRQGKTRLFNRGIYPMWRDSPNGLFIDNKGDDPEFQLGKRVVRIPSERDQKLAAMLSLKKDGDKHHYRLTIPRGAANRDASRQAVTAALDWAWEIRDCLIYLDEIRALTDPNTGTSSLGLRAEVEEMYLRAGYRDDTIVACTQGPAWVPSAFYEQPAYLYIAKFMDKRARDRLSEIGGDTEQIDAAMMSLQQYEFLFVADGGEYMEITKCDR